jgi:uncharacterized protein (UPF0303 family)
LRGVFSTPNLFPLTFFGAPAVKTEMNIDQDLAIIARQEQSLCFQKFDEHTAWEIGTRLKAAAEKLGGAVAIDVTLAGHSVFSYVMPGASPNNTNWVRRKRNTVQHFHRSSYGLGRQLERDKADLFGKFGLSLSDYAVHGGSFPIRVLGTGVVGAVTVSGLPQREDHKVVVEVLADFLQKPMADLSLD